MKMIYITLPSTDVAKSISRALIEARVVGCTNMLPMQSMYRWDGQIQEDHEVVLIAKTVAGRFDKVVQIVGQHIDYVNCVAELDALKVNQPYWDWMVNEVQPK